MEELTVDAAGGDLAVVDHGGAGAPIVLLHGGGRTAADWGPVIPHLAGAGRVLAVDFRGHGRSAKRENFTYDAGVDDVTAVVQGLGLDRPLVVGHSLGGMIASIYAARGGECRAMINVDGHGAGHPSQFDGIPPDEVADALVRFAELSVEGFESIGDGGDAAWLEQQITEFRTAVEGSSTFTWDVAEPVVRRGFRQLEDGSWERSPNAAINVSMYLSLRGLDMMAYYRKLECPSVIIYTTGDAPEQDPEIERLLAAHRIGLRRQLNEVAAENPRIELASFPTGHMVMFDAPKDLGALIARVAREVV